MPSAWELPAGQAFVDEIRDRLERGDQLTTCLPTHVDAELLAQRLAQSLQLFAHHVFDVGSVAGADPLEVLLAELRVPIEPGELASVDTLVASGEAAGVAIWLLGAEALTDTDRRAWGRLTRELCRATRRLGGEGLPPRIVWLAVGHLPELEPCEPGWSKLMWWARMGRLDTSLHVQRVAPEADGTLRSCVVELAGFDLALAERLAIEWPADLDRLAVLLGAEGEARGFAAAPAATSARCGRDGPGRLASSWVRGEVDVYDGEASPFWHSCLYLGEAGLLRLRRRLWRGQVNQILPRLEEWRMQLIEVAKAEGFIAGGVTLDDLEFKELHNHLRAGHQGLRRSQLADFAGWLRGARNRLAHLQLLDPATHSRGEHLAARCLP